VETKESLMSKVVESMRQITTGIGPHKFEVVFEACIMDAANSLVGNYNVAEYNTC
jgi:hypothetical protein